MRGCVQFSNRPFGSEYAGMGVHILCACVLHASGRALGCILLHGVGFDVHIPGINAD